MKTLVTAIVIVLATVSLAGAQSKKGTEKDSVTLKADIGAISKVVK